MSPLCQTGPRCSQLVLLQVRTRAPRTQNGCQMPARFLPCQPSGPAAPRPRDGPLGHCPVLPGMCRRGGLSPPPLLSCD